MWNFPLYPCRPTRRRDARYRARYRRYIAARPSTRAPPPSAQASGPAKRGSAPRCLSTIWIFRLDNRSPANISRALPFSFHDPFADGIVDRRIMDGARGIIYSGMGIGDRKGEGVCFVRELCNFSFFFFLSIFSTIS